MTRLLGFAVATLMAFPAFAAERGFYIGAGGGGSQIDADFADIGIQPVTSEPYLGSRSDGMGNQVGGSLDGNDAGFRAFLGYRIFDYLAVEAGYVNLGEPQGFSCFTFTAADVTDDIAEGDCRDLGWRAAAELDGYEVGINGIWPFNDTFEVFGRAGIFVWDLEAKGNDRVRDALFEGQPPGTTQIILPNTGSLIIIPRGPDPIRADRDGSDLMLSIGGSAKVSESISLRAEYQWFDVSDADTVYMMSLSAIWQF